MALLQEVGQAVIKLVYDDKDLEKQGDKVSLKLGAKLKTAAAAGATAIVAGVTAATKAVGDLAKQSTEAYGQFEQLQGGIQKIFDEMDYNAIAKDAQNAWQDLNLSASQYMESITGIGSTFAQTMGDKKGYEAARTGMKAIADYSSGTGKNIDELMGKFQLITRSTTSYLSIADQFSGILPQTTTDFLKQAQAAGYLSDQYKKLNDVPIAEYQEAVTKMVEKGVKDMGLLGNTAAETANTLTGSMAGFKSTMQNLITGLADPQANIEELVETTVKAGADLAKNFGTIFTRALKGAITALREIIPKALPILTEMAAEVVPMLIEAGIDAFDEILLQAPNIIQTLLNLASTVIDRIAGKLPELMTAITTAIVQTIVLLTKPENILLIIKAATTLLMAIVEAIPAIIEALSEALPDIIANIVEWMTSPEALAEITMATLTLLGAMIAAVPRIIKSLGEALAKSFKALWNRLTSIFTEFGRAFGGAIGGAFAKAINGVLSFVEKALNGPINAINKVIGVLNAIPGVNVGQLGNIKLPRVALAEGGITTGPTTALIGERGREAVIPLEQNTGNWAGLLAGKLAEEFRTQGENPTESNITVYMTNNINSELDIDRIQQELTTAIRRAA